MTDAAVSVEASALEVPEHLVVQRGAAPVRKLRYENLTGQQKVAIVLAQLRQETSAVILKTVGDEEAVPSAVNV